MIRTLSLAAVAASLALAGCATTYESQIRSSLMNAGLSRSVAGCMADRMSDRLSNQQMRSLARLSTGGRRVGDMTVAEFLRRASALVDPHVYAVVTRASIGCSIAG